jgi:hypothetical protein
VKSEVLNPFMRLATARDGKVILHAPVRGRGLVTTALVPPLARLLEGLIAPSGGVPDNEAGLNEGTRRLLRHIGAILPQDMLPKEVGFAAPTDLARLGRHYRNTR